MKTPKHGDTVLVEGARYVWCKLCGWQGDGHIRTSHFGVYRGAERK